MAAVLLAAAAIAPAGAAVTKADVANFSDTLAAQTRACGGMVGTLNMMNTSDPAAHNVYLWSEVANAAKVCAANVHSETSDASPLRVPQTALASACTMVKKLHPLPTDLAMTSWACGWPSPVPDMRPVPGPMP